MRIARPSVTEERWLALAARYPQLREAARAQPGSDRWRCATLLSRCLFLALGVFAAGLGYSVLDLLRLPVPAVLAGLALLVIAEWLIARRALHASGIEEALWSAGAVLVAFGMLDEIGGIDDSVGLAVIAATLALAGWRLLNPLFTTLAAACASIAIATLSDGARSLDRLELAGYASFAGAFFALAAGARNFQRPGFDRMLDWLVVTLPALGYFWTLWGRSGSFTFNALRSGTLELILPAALLLAFGLAALFTGLRRRTHASLIAALICVVLLAAELRKVTGLPLEWRLILWGLVGLGLAISIERWLRRPRAGITSANIDSADNTLELLQLGGTAVLVTGTGSPAPQAPEMRGQGGEFGGGGASGRF